MEYADLFAEALQESEPSKQYSHLKRSTPDGVNLGDMLWAGYRAGLLQPTTDTFWWTMQTAPCGFTAAEGLALLKAASLGPYEQRSPRASGATWPSMSGTSAGSWRTAATETPGLWKGMATSGAASGASFGSCSPCAATTSPSIPGSSPRSPAA